MTQTFNATHYDALIIGGRCAGAATGMLLARDGAKVLIVERDNEIGDTLSTHALMRPAVTLLDRWGLLEEIVQAGTPAIQNTQFHYGPMSFQMPIKPAGGVDGLFAPRRWLLDRVLGDAAVRAGAELRTGTRFVSLLKDPTGRVTGAVLQHADGTTQSVRAGIVIGADGRNSSVAKAVNAPLIRQSDHASATVYTYVDGLPNEGYRWYYAHGLYAGLIPTTDGAHCLGTSCNPNAMAHWIKGDAFGGALKILATWEPEIAAELRAAGPTERLRRFVGAPGHIRDCAGPGWALVGDAGYFKDPCTAHGITDALLDAHRLAQALRRDPSDASAYQVERDRFAPQLFDATQKIAAMDWSIPEVQALHIQLNNCVKAEQWSLKEDTLSLAA